MPILKHLIEAILYSWQKRFQHEVRWIIREESRHKARRIKPRGKPKCKNCQWSKKMPRDEKPVDKQNVPAWNCRFKPPKDGLYPRVKKSDVCSEHMFKNKYVKTPVRRKRG